MKHFFLKTLPLAAAIVVATSCSKDKDEVKPEDVTPKESSVTMTFKVGSSAGLSKIGLVEDNGDFGVALKFDGNEVITFTDDEGLVTGSVTLTSSNLKNDGKTAEFNVSFKGEEKNIEKFKAGEIKLTASIGSKLTEISSESYSSLEDAIRANSYQLSNAPIGYSESLTEITFEEQTAYFEIGLPVKVETVNINDKDISLNKGRGWIALPVGTIVTSEALSLNNKEVTAAKIYSVYRKAFSVSASKKVHFSEGNLQYNLRTKNWRFALNQYDKCFLKRFGVGGDYSVILSQGFENESVDEYGLCVNGWTDLFGWGRWIKDQEPGTTPLDDENYFSSINKDGDLLVGEAAIGPDWNTLEINEWAYLLYYRENADQKYGAATVCDVNGVVILPDDWKAPDGISFTPGMASTYGSAYYGENNQYNAESWNKMESAGAVFLPVTGILTMYREDPLTVAYQKSAAYYWSSTSGDYYYYDTNDYRADGDKHWYVSYEMEFSSVSVDVTRKSRRHYGCSVRLVRDLGGTFNSNKVIGNFGNVEEKW